MPRPVRIGVIGAGSAQFSLGLVKDLCLTENLKGSEVSFMDVDQERLDAVTALAIRYTEEVGSDLRFEKTTVRADCMVDADFVINTASVQGHHHARKMRDLIAKYGYYHTGVSAGSFYQFRLMLEVARDIEAICPDAWLIQSGNPVFEGGTLMTRETDVKVCALCHGHYGYHDIARVLGLDLERVDFQAPGLNHNIWMTHFLYDGEDAYPWIDKWIETDAEEYWKAHVAEKTHDIQMSRGGGAPVPNVRVVSDRGYPSR